jgi:ABC-2 type transport system permease protein
VAFGLAIAAIGCTFAAVTAVAAQVTDSARTDTLISLGVLGASYLVRFVADGTGQLWLKWVSPHGWAHLLEPFGNERWFMLLVIPLAFASLVWAAYSLAQRRDLGAGVVATRPGPTTAPRLRSPLALAWRLQRAQLVLWVAGFAVAGTALGGMATTLPEVVRGSTWGQEFLTRYSGSARAPIADVFLELIVVTLGMTAVFFPVVSVLQARGDETTGRAELVLSTATGRAGLLASYVAIALGGTVLILGAAGAALGAAYGIGSGDVPGEVARLVAGALLHVPAAGVLGGLAVLLVGVIPRYAIGLAWAALLYVQLIGEVVGPVLLGPAYSYQVVNGLQPFHWIPKITSGGALSAAPLVVLGGLTLLLLASGTVAFRRRDVPG